MTTSSTLQGLVTLVFALLNGAMLYLFSLQLPFSAEALLQSFRHWDRVSPYIGVVAAMATGVTVVALLLKAMLGDLWKHRLLYFKMQQAHPAHQAFFGSKDTGLDLERVNRAYPEVRDSAWAPNVQLEAWNKLYRKHAEVQVVAGTRAAWSLLCDLYLLSLVFLAAFVIAWPLNTGVVFAFAAPYLFVFGGQAIFLCLSARGVGWRLVVNVLGTELGMKPEDEKGKRSKRS